MLRHYKRKNYDRCKGGRWNAENLKQAIEYINAGQSRPVDDWWYDFKQRYQLSLKKPERVEGARARKAHDPFTIEDFYDKLENCDESGFCPVPGSIRVICGNRIPAKRITEGNDQNMTTVSTCVNASGQYLPPTIIYKEYPSLLIYDGHALHIGVDLIKLALANDMIILKLPFHILQPLDVVVFRGLKSKWDSILTDWARNHISQKPSKTTNETNQSLTTAETAHTSPKPSSSASKLGQNDESQVRHLRQVGVKGRWKRLVWGFMKRHTDLSLRKPESTSLCRSMAFNKPVIYDFFNKYTSVLQKHKFNAEQIWNLDETGITTVMRSVKIVSAEGTKQVGQIASSERESAIRQNIYLTDHQQDLLGNKSRWMTSELFPEVLKHIVDHTYCSAVNKILLLVDNHESHISVEAIRYYKSNGITLLSFPPHTTHRLQPLDVGIYAPFKTHLATAFNDLMLAHPGQAITLRHIGNLSNKAYQNAFSIKSIKSAFKKTGLWPLDWLIFTESDFAASSVTDKPLDVDEQKPASTPEISYTELSTTQSKKLSEENHFNPDRPSTLGQDSNNSVNNTRGPSLEELCPYPKADMSKKRTGKSKSTVYTDSPELLKRENILQLKKKREEDVKNERGLKIDLFKKVNLPNKRRKTKNDRANSSFSNSDVFLDEVNSCSSNDLDLEELETMSSGEFEIGNFVLAKFFTKSLLIHYVGQVEAINDPLLTVKFMRRKGTGGGLSSNCSSLNK
ncbi:hypothetical protein ILUMI_19031 [Ignelater luminosus]|uniref:DDE-1 domain-containing protein n=1 Tax=Ignelater luminosus TaxID=2038154 RepID=A0A8K0G3K8_IGNLU|nr:hypothetical protein ILUMI_19031 [Ignelater luminosus]